jgi:hypothetical protein
MWELILLAVIAVVIGAMVFLPTINTRSGDEPKCSSCPKKAARDSMASQ